jgi:putative tricarboxylic transport membrane protein
MKRDGVSVRSAEVAVALIIGALGAVVMADSVRVGIGWADDGPRAGYFPFYVGCALVIAGLGIAGQTLARWSKLAAAQFVSWAEIKPVLAVLVPTIAYVALIAWIGLYVASALYIATFMVWQGKYRWLPTLLVSVGVPVVVFLLFEVWFLVPLPKGPLEHWLGY